MDLSFVVKDPDKAYVSDRLWLPKSKVRTESIKRALEFLDAPEPIVMWEESRHHIICPREFIPPGTYANYKFPFVDLSPAFQKVEFEDLVVPRDEAQVKAWAAFRDNHNGILNLACGKGKTRLALKKIAQMGVPTLVVVPDSTIFSQWEESIFGNAKTGIVPGLSFKGELGVIKGPVFNWAKPVTLALVTTLWRRILDGAVPEEMFRYFGLVVYDEVHQIGAPKFSLTAYPFYGNRIGLTATVQREDGLDFVYRYHIGDPFYSDLSQQLVPNIYFQSTPVSFDWKAARNAAGTTNMSILRTFLGRHKPSNVYRYWSIKRALDEGRKILCLGHSKDQLRLMSSLFPGSALIVQETPKAERMEILRKSRICFASFKLGSTGVDDDNLDALFALSPFKAKGGLQQSMGRILRIKPGKPKPVMVVFDDWLIPPLHRLSNKLKTTLHEWGYKTIETRPEKLPQDLPEGLDKSYTEMFSQLPERGESEDDDE